MSNPAVTKPKGTPDFRPGNSPVEITQIEPGDFGYLAKHLIKSPGDKKVPGRIAGRPDPAKNRSYRRPPSGTVQQPLWRAKQRSASQKHAQLLIILANILSRTSNILGTEERSTV